MAARKKTSAANKATPTVNEESARFHAKLALMPSANAAAVLESYGKPFGEQEINALITELRGKFQEVKAGDLSHCEHMLMGQAQALQSIFVYLSRRAAC